MGVGASSYGITFCRSQDFVHAGGSLEHLSEGIHTQSQHAMLESELFDFKTARAVVGQLSDLFIGDKKLIDTEPAVVTEPSAHSATLGAKQWLAVEFLQREIAWKFVFGGMVRLFALGAQSPDQALCHNPFDGARDEEWFDSHVDNPSEGTSGIIRVEGAEHRVTGEGGLDGILCGFRIADFTDEDNVGVMAEDASQGGGKRQTDLRMDLDLIDAIELVLDGVFGRDDLVLGGSDLQQRAVQSRGFSGTGGAGDQDNSVWDSDEFTEDSIGFFTHPQASQVEFHGPFIEDPHDQTFAVDHRDNADPNIDLAAVDAQFDPTVLRQSLFGDVEFCHDLQTRDDGGLEAIDLRWNGLVLKDAVDTVANDDPCGLRFDVNVAGTRVDGFHEDFVDQSDHGRFLGLFAQLASIGFEFLKQFDLIVFVASGSHQAFDGFASDPEMLFNKLRDFDFFCDERYNWTMQCGGSFVEWVEFQRVAGGDKDASAFFADGENTVPVDQLLREVRE